MSAWWPHSGVLPPAWTSRAAPLSVPCERHAVGVGRHCREPGLCCTSRAITAVHAAAGCAIDASRSVAS